MVKMKLMVVAVFATVFVFSAKSSKLSTLKLVHVLFRHGQRTPTKFYPNDPHINISYSPYGLGELTKVGQEQMFKLGKKIRKKYNLFLDELYTPEIFEATCSFFSRTKTSLQLFLYGLFPLPEKYRFNPNITFQPIPYREVANGTDEIFTTSDFCPNFYKALESHIKSPQYLKIELNDKSALQYIEKNSGLKMTSYHDIFKIIGTLKCEQEWGLPLPTWTNNVFPKKIEQLLFKGYELMTANIELTKITAGGLIRKIIDDSLAKTDKNSSFAKKQLIVYSGHDITIGGLLGATKMMSLELMPNYAAHMLIELHYVNKTYGFKFYYAADLKNDIIELKMRNCEEFCSLQQFIELTKDFIPQADTCRSKDSSNHYSWTLFITCSFMSLFYIILFICLFKYKSAFKCTQKIAKSQELRNLNDSNT